MGGPVPKSPFDDGPPKHRLAWLWVIITLWMCFFVAVFLYASVSALCRYLGPDFGMDLFRQ